jgi:hypothetical protein
MLLGMHNKENYLYATKRCRWISLKCIGRGTLKFVTAVPRNGCQRTLLCSHMCDSCTWEELWRNIPYILTLVLELMGAPRSSIMSTTCSCPDLAAQWRGVRPSRVLDSMLAPFSRSSDTMLVLPHLAATCKGVILCCENIHNLLSLQSQEWMVVPVAPD